MKPVALIAAAVALSLPSLAHAGVYGDALGKCMVDSSSVDDHSTVVRWMFSAMSMNPAVRPLASITPEQRDGYSKDMAKVIGKLLIQNCRKEAVAALKNEGTAGFENSFGLLGEVAMRSLMTPEASNELGRFTNYLDMAKVHAMLVDAGMPPPTTGN